MNLRAERTDSADQVRNFSEAKAELSVVVPAHDEEGNLSKLYAELMRVLPALDMSWEMIVVDDGSKDDTWKEIASLYKEDSRVKGIRLSRNFGHQYALLAGLCKAEGEAIVSMDADLQHPPEIIPALVDQWRKGSKIVHTVRTDPEDFSLFKKLASRLFYKLFSFLSGVRLEKGMADYRLLDRQVLSHILQLKEEGIFLRGIVHWIGYPSSVVGFQSANRESGKSKYTFTTMLKFAWHGISSFSIVPLRLAILVGIFTSGLSFLAVANAVYTKLVTGKAVPGWASSVSILSFLFGVLFILLGIIGEYIGRLLIEVRQRPRFLIADQIGIIPHSSKEEHVGG